MGWLSKLLGAASSSSDDTPFMEHPSGDFDSAVEAMTDAIERLRKLPGSEKWITFSAQGQAEGGGEESYHFADVKMRGSEIAIGDVDGTPDDRPLDIARIIQAAGTPANALAAAGENYSIAAASPRQAAQIFDAIFRHHLGIRPFPDEENDYAVGAEW